MRIGDLVRYRTPHGGGPLAIVVAVSGDPKSFHGRVRVMWAGNELPLQAHVCSTRKDSKITTWMKPGHFKKAF